MTINNLPIIFEISVDKISEKRKVTITVTNQYVYNLVKDYLPFEVVNIIYPLSTQIDYLKFLQNMDITGEVIYGIGGGESIDVGKYLAAQKKIDFYAIPTIISTDAFLSDCVAVRRKGCVEYLPVPPPKKVFIDFKIIEKANKRFNLSGIGDVMAIFTSVSDWKYAFSKNKLKESTSYSAPVKKIAMEIPQLIFSNKKEIKNMTPKGIRILIRALALKVVLSNIMGHSRIQEGSEHFFVYNLENYNKKNFLHGEAVILGIKIMSFFQKQNIGIIKKFIKEFGFRKNPDIEKEAVVKSLYSISKYVKKHNLPYSIANEIYITKKKINNVLKEINLN